MRPLGHDEIRGTWGTVLLPINEDESIDYGRLEDEVERMIEAGVDGLYTNGSAGEFCSQTEVEFDRVSSIVAERCEDAGVPFQIGVSHPSAQTSLERLKRVLPLHPGALQVTLPDWIPPSDKEATSFLQRMAAAAAGVTLVLYNPPHAKRVLGLEDIASLKEAVPTLVGIKVADGDATWYAAMRRLSGLSVFVPGHHLATGIAEGAHGSYSNVACLSPGGAVRWCELMHSNAAAAWELQSKILRFLHEHVDSFRAAGFSNPALDKLLAAAGGWANVGTRLRWPYRWVPEEAARCLSITAREYIPELLEPWQ